MAFLSCSYQENKNIIESPPSKASTIRRQARIYIEVRAIGSRYNAVSRASRACRAVSSRARSCLYDVLPEYKPILFLVKQ